jgi:hypothetical protein
LSEDGHPGDLDAKQYGIDDSGSHARCRAREMAQPTA